MSSIGGCNVINRFPSMHYGSSFSVCTAARWCVAYPISPCSLGYFSLKIVECYKQREIFHTLCSIAGLTHVLKEIKLWKEPGCVKSPCVAYAQECKVPGASRLSSEELVRSTYLTAIATPPRSGAHFVSSMILNISQCIKILKYSPLLFLKILLISWPVLGAR